MPEAHLFRGIPTGPEVFLENAGHVRALPCARTHLKRALCHTSPVGGPDDKYLTDVSPIGTLLQLLGHTSAGCVWGTVLVGCVSPGGWGASLLWNADGTRNILGTAGHVWANVPAPGPTLKRPCAVFLRLVGREMYTWLTGRRYYQLYRCRWFRWWKSGFDIRPGDWASKIKLDSTD